MLSCGKIYMVTQAGHIVGLDLPTERLFLDDQPDGAEHDQYRGNLVHCQGEDFLFYIFHVDGVNRLDLALKHEW